MSANNMFALLTVLALLVFSGCGSDDDNPASSGGGAATNNPSFASDIQPLFSSNGCTLAGCHGSAESGGLSLLSARAYTELVGVTSSGEPSFKRVLASKADSSILIIKLEGRQAVGARMPYPPRPALSATEIQNIKNWINQGAPNN